MTCAQGILNSECSRCECAINFQAQVFNTDSEPLPQVSVYHVTSPWSVAVTSSADGRFSLSGLCDGQELKLEKDGYISQEVNTDQAGRIVLQRIGK